MYYIPNLVCDIIRDDIHEYNNENGVRVIMISLKVT